MLYRPWIPASIVTCPAASWRLLPSRGCRVHLLSWIRQGSASSSGPRAAYAESSLLEECKGTPIGRVCGEKLGYAFAVVGRRFALTAYERRRGLASRAREFAASLDRGGLRSLHSGIQRWLVISARYAGGDCQQG
jgi:hypothetical protein